MGDKIVRAAIRHDGAVWSLPPPARHGHVIQEMAKRPNHETGHTHDQGFLTSSGAFVDRKQGWMIADAAHQLLDRAPTDGIGGILYSEDVW